MTVLDRARRTQVKDILDCSFLIWCGLREYRIERPGPGDLSQKHRLGFCAFLRGQREQNRSLPVSAFYYLADWHRSFRMLTSVWNYNTPPEHLQVSFGGVPRVIPVSRIYVCHCEATQWLWQSRLPPPRRLVIPARQPGFRTICVWIVGSPRGTARGQVVRQ
jgi:hypothetical protein